MKSKNFSLSRIKRKRDQIGTPLGSTKRLSRHGEYTIMPTNRGRLQIVVFQKTFLFRSSIKRERDQLGPHWGTPKGYPATGDKKFR